MERASGWRRGRHQRHGTGSRERHGFPHPNELLEDECQGHRFHKVGVGPNPSVEVSLLGRPQSQIPRISIALFCSGGSGFDPRVRQHCYSRAQTTLKEARERIEA